mmetsp:Transcript_42252/g.80778  ORF Transcript_42252/g.80778 Transcript_42252/m.80778 type:complete len:91 (+) Transcript_42252:365-637(+)
MNAPMHGLFNRYSTVDFAPNHGCKEHNLLVPIVPSLLRLHDSTLSPFPNCEQARMSVQMMWMAHRLVGMGMAFVGNLCFAHGAISILVGA